MMPRSRVSLFLMALGLGLVASAAQADMYVWDFCHERQAVLERVKQDYPGEAFERSRCHDIYEGICETELHLSMWQRYFGNKCSFTVTAEAESGRQMKYFVRASWKTGMCKVVSIEEIR